MTRPLSIGVAGLGPQAVGLQHAADAPAADRMALGLHFRPQSTRAVALAVVRKRFAHRYLPGGLKHCLVPLPVPRVIRAGGHAQHLAELAHGHLAGSLGNVLVGAHRVGWPKMTKAFFKMSSSCSARFSRARRARTSGSRATSSLPTSATSCACCQR